MPKLSQGCGRQAGAGRNGERHLERHCQWRAGSFKYTITGMTAPGYAYDASLNKMTSNAITK